MAEEQHKRPSPTPSDESLSSKKLKALQAPPVVVKQEPGEVQVAQGGMGWSLARAAAGGPVNLAVERPRFNVSFEVRLFHCAVAECYSPLKPPVHKCEAGGHLLCDNCRRDGQCRICDGAATFVRCPEVDRFINGARVPCPYEASGCDASVVYHEIPEHRDACTFAPCPCLAPGCDFKAPPPALRDHLAGEHGWTVHRLSAYAKAHTLRVPGAAESQRLLVVEGDAPRVFLLSLRRRGEGAVAVSLACVRAGAAAAGPHYKCCLWAAAPTPPDAPRQMERRVMLETDVASCAAPGGPAVEAGLWLYVMPEMLHGPSKEVQLRIRIEEIRPASASARSANAPRSVVQA
ncbi:hypothetical protein EJB05_31829 [Eragrostis curvula]|uniref:SIAH-type domain-containing protein n=1 Tax=Eragrostis curvula TaxID=38414 RepID=A0A5J9UFN8_9POAL|nr:hypothetical protein EJB05_31829 [Eragrostis curvula]